MIEPHKLLNTLRQTAYEYYNEYNKYCEQNRDSLAEIDLEVYPGDKLTLLSNAFVDQFRTLLEVRNYYWQFCSASILKENYDRQLSNFLKSKIDSTEVDYLEFKLIQIKKGLIVTLNNKAEIEIKLPSEIEELIKYSRERKEEFLTAKLKSLMPAPQDERREMSETEVICDYSDNDIKMKIAFMHELGIIDYLIKKTGISSGPKLSEVISSFTGEKGGRGTSSQKYINDVIAKRDLHDEDKKAEIKAVVKEWHNKNKLKSM